MSDLVKRLREIGNDTDGSKYSHAAADEIERLQSRVAELEKERDDFANQFCELRCARDDYRSERDSIRKALDDRHEADKRAWRDIMRASGRERGLPDNKEVIAYLIAENERLEKELTGARDAVKVQNGVVISSVDKAIAASKKLPCGHHASSLVTSVESDHEFCEVCDLISQRNDAVAMEEALLKERDSLRAENRTLREALRRIEVETGATFSPSAANNVIWKVNSISAAALSATANSDTPIEQAANDAMLYGTAFIHTDGSGNRRVIPLEEVLVSSPIPDWRALAEKLAEALELTGCATDERIRAALSEFQRAKGNGDES